MIHIRLNGQEKSIPEQLSVAELVSQFKIDLRHAAIAVNLEVVPPSERETKKLHNGDEIEIFHAVGGG